MTPKQHSKKIINSFKATAHGMIGSEQLFRNCRKSALSAVNLLLKHYPFKIEEKKYWQDVKSEILKQTFDSRTTQHQTKK